MMGANWYVRGSACNITPPSMCRTKYELGHSRVRCHAKPSQIRSKNFFYYLEHCRILRVSDSFGGLVGTPILGPQFLVLCVCVFFSLPHSSRRGFCCFSYYSAMGGLFFFFSPPRIPFSKRRAWWHSLMLGLICLLFSIFPDHLHLRLSLPFVNESSFSFFGHQS